MNRAWTDPQKTFYDWQQTIYDREPSVKPEEPFFSVGEQMQNHKQFLERNRHELALQKLRNVILSGFLL